jgi:aryl-alcohol dehydrogenase-like predicted oxidoreductase
MYAWQFANVLYVVDLHGWTRFVSMQNHYNLLYRSRSSFDRDRCDFIIL